MGRTERRPRRGGGDVLDPERPRPDLTISGIAPGARPSPNIWHHTAVYEAENRAVDPDGVLEDLVRSRHDWAGGSVLDLGCGTGFHLPRFAATAARVVGVEPHGRLVALARRRTADLPHVSVRHATAQDTGLPDRSIDVMHARWAYFFGPGCEPGLQELDRLMRRGGTAFVIDNDRDRSTFGGWFRRSRPKFDQHTVDRFFSMHGWDLIRTEIRWEFERRRDFEAVVGIEFEPGLAAQIIAEHPGRTVDYAVVVRVKRF